MAVGEKVVTKRVKGVSFRAIRHTCENVARPQGESCSVFRQCPDHTSIFLPRLSARASENNRGSLAL